MIELWAQICDAIAADLLAPLEILLLLGIRAPRYAQILWRLAKPFVAASLRAQRKI